MTNTNSKMINPFLRIVTWNANGLKERTQELEIFLRINNIDIALVSETHFTEKSYFKINGYDTFWTNHPSERARGGSAIIIKNNIKYHKQEDIHEDCIQATIVNIQFNNQEVNIAAAYCPPKTTPTYPQWIEIFEKLGSRFIIGGDFNTKHTAWGSRLITPGKGNGLLNAIKNKNCRYHSGRKPTYWPTDTKKIPDLLDFFITKGISENNLEMESIVDLTSDHTPVLLNLNAAVILKKKKLNLTNKHTDWELFRKVVEESINLKTSLKTKHELDQQTERFISLIQDAAKKATPELKPAPIQEVNYPAEIRDLIKERRKARSFWHRSRNARDKNYFNNISNRVNRLTKQYKQKSLDNYLSNLDPGKDKDYSLWKATRRFKRPIIRIPPIKDSRGTWLRRDDEKTEYFAKHLAEVFQPHDIQSNVNTTPTYRPNKKFKKFTPYEVAKEIDGLNRKKAPGIDEIAPGVIKELPKQAIYMATYLFNACLNLKYVPKCFKIAQVIMLLKPDKPSEKVTSYRPISLLPAISKIFEKLLIKRLKPLIKIPDFQFGFRNNHSTIEQIHRLTNLIENTFENQEYCEAAFLDVSQAFDKVWHEGLICKMSKTLPGNYCQLLESYISDRKFRVKDEETYSSFYPILAGVPQGSVLAPLLYTLYTADIPVTKNSFIGTFADDTAIMATNNSQAKAVNQLQNALDKINQWTIDWKIKLNETKSNHITFTLRHKNSNLRIYLNGIHVPQVESAKYLGLHLDNKLNWKHHVKQKSIQMKHKTRQMYWLVGYNSKLNLYCKRLIYRSIFTPIWTYGSALWGCAKKSNIDIIQTSQNKFLRMITNAYRYVTNEEIHKDLEIKRVADVVRENALRHEKKLHKHTNVEAILLLDTTGEVRRLKRVKPHELTY